MILLLHTVFLPHVGIFLSTLSKLALPGFFPWPVGLLSLIVLGDLGISEVLVGCTDWHSQPCPVSLPFSLPVLSRYADRLWAAHRAYPTHCTLDMWTPQLPIRTGTPPYSPTLESWYLNKPIAQARNFRVFLGNSPKMNTSLTMHTSLIPALQETSFLTNLFPTLPGSSSNSKVRAWGDPLA